MTTANDIGPFQTITNVSWPSGKFLTFTGDPHFGESFTGTSDTSPTIILNAGNGWTYGPVPIASFGVDGDGEIIYTFQIDPSEHLFDPCNIRVDITDIEDNPLGDGTSAQYLSIAIPLSDSFGPGSQKVTIIPGINNVTWTLD